MNIWGTFQLFFLYILDKEQMLQIFVVQVMLRDFVIL